MSKRKKKKKKSTGKRFPLEAKAQALTLLERGDVTVEQLADDLGVSERTIRAWRHQVADHEAETPLTKEERARLKAQEREIERLREEVEILKKARVFWEKHRS